MAGFSDSIKVRIVSSRVSFVVLDLTSTVLMFSAVCSEISFAENTITGVDL